MKHPKKLFVLDTNVLLQDPRAIFNFGVHEVVLPIYVIEEIDKFKKQMDELGRNARSFSRLIDDLRHSSRGGGLQGGVKLPSGGLFRISVPADALLEATTGLYDNRILKLALQEKAAHPGKKCVLVSRDINVRVRADALGLVAEDYESGKVETEQLEHSVQEIVLSPSMFDAFASKQPLDIDVQLNPNASCLLRNEYNPKQTFLARFDGRSKQLRHLYTPKQGVMGIRPRNLEQSFALDLLLDDSIQLVTLLGKAGTGKTLLAVAAGLHKTAVSGTYSKLLVSRPVMPLGRDVGYLPGTLEEKMSPWMQPIFDNLEYIFTSSKQESSRSYEELMASGIIQVEALTYIRGRSIPQQYMIVDEAQNLSVHEVRTIITRAGEGTKIVLTGDPNQIDSPLLDASSNGLTVVADKFREQVIAGHMTLSRGERSPLAEIASQIL